MSQNSKPYLFSLFAGNFLSHYDVALFWALSPFLAPLLFPNMSALEGLTLFYLLIPLSKWARPLGAWVLGKWSIRIGAHKILLISLTGLAFSCIAMVFCPTSNSVIAFTWVGACRIIVYFFSSSESSASSMLILKNQEEKKGLLSGWIGSIHLMGYFCAALCIAIIAGVSQVELHWRWLYGSGAFAGIIAIFLRIIFRDKKQDIVSRSLENPLEGKVAAKLLHKKVVAKIALAACFSCGTYEVPMSVAYSTLPLITAIEKTHLLWMNWGLLAFDALLLPVCGRLAQRWGIPKVMGIAALVWALSCGFFLDHLHGAGFIQVALLRGVLVLIGVVFAAPYYAWAKSILPEKKEIFHLGLGCSIGKYIGGFLPVMILFLYQKTSSFGIASIPVVILSIITGGFLIQEALVDARKEKDPAIESI